MRDHVRQSGRTTKQLTDAARNALYVVPTRASISYTRELAERLHRDDIILVAPLIFEGPEKFRGLGVLPPLIIDHAVVLTDRQQYGVKMYHQRRILRESVYKDQPAEYALRIESAAASLRRNLR